MARLWDSFNTTADVVYSITTSSNQYTSETFTASSSYTITSVKLSIKKTTSSTIVLTVGIYAVDVNRKPTGSALASGSIANASISTSQGWVECAFSAGYLLTVNTEYAIVVNAPSGTGTITWYGELTGNVYVGKSWYGSNGTTWTESTVSDTSFRTYTTFPSDEKYSKSLIAIGNNEVWYETPLGTMTELTAATGDLDVSFLLSSAEAYQKLFIANGTKKKVVDFINTKITTTDAGLNPCTIGMTLTGGTSTGVMIVDYVDGITDNSAANIYGKRTSDNPFEASETVTGTNSAGNAVSFVLSVNEVAPPHWYTWTTFGQDTTNYGTLLVQPTLICLYRGRIVISGDGTLPHAWQMTKVGNPWKVLYDFNNDGDVSAVTHTNTKVGLIGDIITALIPYKDDLLIFGCANSIWILIGDPLSEGQLAEITNNTGIWGPKAWCIDDRKSLYFLGNDGIYQMPVGETSNLPTNISKGKLPQLMTSLDLDKSLHRVVLSYDPIENGIIVSKTLLSDGTNTNYFYSLLTGGFFPESYPTSCGIFSSYYYPATDETYKKFLVGCTDGYIREFDGATKNDTTTSSTAAIGSYCTILQQVGQDENTNGMLHRFTGIVAGGASGGDFSDTDGVSFELHKGEDAETVLEDIKDGATAFTSGSWSTTGKQNSVRPRMKGVWAGIKLYNSTASQTWAVEKLYGDVIQKGNT